MNREARGSSGGGWKILSIFLAIVLVAAGILTGVFYALGDITFGKAEEQSEAKAEAVAYAEDGSALESGSTVPMQNMSFATARSLAAYSSDAAAQSEEYASVELTATLSPDWVAGDLSWSIAFSDPASEWATGKTVTDYVTLTPNETALTATVQCLQPFGEQIVVTVSADEFEGVSASCTVDFAQRVKTVIYKDSQNLGSDGNGIDFSTAEYIVWDHGFREQNTFTLTTVYYDYTVACDVNTDGNGGYVMGSNPNAGRYPAADGVSCLLPKYGVTFNWNGENTKSLFEMTSENSPGDTMSDEGAKELETWLSVYADENDIYAFNGSLKATITEGYDYRIYGYFHFFVPLRLNASKFEATVDLGLDDTGIVV